MILEARNVVLAGRLDGVSAALRPGAITAICGPNGAGKSSLLQCLAGLLAPEHGDVMLGDTALAATHARTRARACSW